MKKSLEKPVYILGINEALCASAALLKDGEIIAAASEERFTRIKNCWGLPKKAIDYCLESAKINSKDLDLVVLSYVDPYPHFVLGRAQERSDFIPSFLKKLRNLSPKIEYTFPFLTITTDLLRKIYYDFYLPRFQKKQVNEISQKLKVAADKIIRINHHLCHAHTAYYAHLDRTNNKTLVLTNDGAGDQISASAYTVEKGKFKLVSETPYTHSLGLFYSAVTGYLGLKPHEDEYKVMGLAPYAENANIQKILDIFQKLIWVKGLRFESLIPSRQFGEYLKQNLYGFRFDHIAGACQKHFENLMLQWVVNAIHRTQAKQIVCSGGSFLNVKANKLIVENLKLKKNNPLRGKNFFFMPSPGDESNAIGATYFGYAKVISNFQFPISNLKPLQSLYLGPEYSEEEILTAFKKYPKFKARRIKNIEKEVARLLANGEIVARFAGRMEFGARALGNRSILADPRNRNVIEKINKMIKMRDFWMPFAPTILSERTKDYISQPSDSPYMILAFDTTEKGKKEFSGAIHPYDKSVRPQILSKEMNPSYYKLITEFRKITGVAGILNTSFNIHGEPIVASPEDALSTLNRSGLLYLAIENFLVTKK